MPNLREKLEALRYAHEKALPQRVLRCAAFFEDRYIRVRFFRNREAKTCADAANKRPLLGFEGVPLWHELKTIIFEYDDGEAIRFVAANCRADRKLDPKKIREQLGLTAELREASDVSLEIIDMSFAMINPFLLGDEIVQVFDTELAESYGWTGNVFTNVGVLTWGAEFNPSELVSKLANARWANITLSRFEVEQPTTLPTWGPRQPKKIGIIGGNPTDSIFNLGKKVQAHIRALQGRKSRGDVSMPRYVTESDPNVGAAPELQDREESLLQTLLELVDKACASGAKILAHPAHTTHYFAPQLAAQAAKHGARFLSMTEATAKKLHADGVKEIALLGMQSVTNLGPWSPYRDAFEGITVHQPSEYGWGKIQELAQMVQTSQPKDKLFNCMRHIVQDKTFPESCEYFVLAMTEFDEVFQHVKGEKPWGKIFIDPMDIYAETIAREWLELREV